MTLYNLVVSQNTKYWYSRSLEAVTNQVQYTLTTLSLNRIRMPTDVMNDEMWKLFRGIPGNHSPLTHNPPPPAAGRRLIAESYAFRKLIRPPTIARLVSALHQRPAKPILVLQKTNINGRRHPPTYRPPEIARGPKSYLEFAERVSNYFGVGHTFLFRFSESTVFFYSFFYRKFYRKTVVILKILQKKKTVDKKL